MGVGIITFEGETDLKETARRGVPAYLLDSPRYSKVYEQVGSLYPVVHADSHATIFAGKNGERIILNDNSLTTGIHRLVLVDVPEEVTSRLVKLIKE